MLGRSKVCSFILETAGIHRGGDRLMRWSTAGGVRVTVREPVDFTVVFDVSRLLNARESATLGLVQAGLGSCGSRRPSRFFIILFEALLG